MTDRHKNSPNTSIKPTLLGQIVSYTEAVLDASTLCCEAEHWFNEHPTMPALPLVKNEKPVGLVTRIMFQKYYFTGFGRELNGKKNIAVLMNQSPFIADAQQPISQVSLQIIKDHPLALEEGIIVTDNSFWLYMDS
jgi:hypothetical protein